MNGQQREGGLVQSTRPTRTLHDSTVCGIHDHHFSCSISAWGGSVQIAKKQHVHAGHTGVLRHKCMQITNQTFIATD